MVEDRRNPLEQALGASQYFSDELHAFASLVKPMSEAKGFTLEELSRVIDSGARHQQLPVSRHHALLDSQPMREGV